MRDGSMSGDEYLRRAAELNKNRSTAGRRPTIYRHKRRAARPINEHVLARHFQRAAKPSTSEQITTVIDFSDAKLPAAHQVQYRGVDLVIRGVHNLPTRIHCAHPSFIGHHSATEPMRAQMASGKYPTLEEHHARSSIAYEPFIDEMGQFVAKQLTREEEDAICTRSD